MIRPIPSGNDNKLSHRWKHQAKEIVGELVLRINWRVPRSLRQCELCPSWCADKNPGNVRPR